jgi:hypothetical protein
VVSSDGGILCHKSQVIRHGVGELRLSAKVEVSARVEINLRVEVSARVRYMYIISPTELIKTQRNSTQRTLKACIRIPPND